MKKNQNRSSKNKVVNILYFIDSNKTKTFKISLNKLYFTITTLIVLFAWSLLCTFLLYEKVTLTDYQENRITYLLGTIFQYQQRYDSIYEKSYPDTPKQFETAISKIEIEEQVKNKSELVNPTETITKDNKNIESPKTLVVKKEVRPKKAKAMKDFNSTLEDFSGTIINGKKLDIKFSIRNQNKPYKTSGYVFAKALFQKGSAAVSKISPDYVKLDSSGTPRGSKGYKYNIRYFKTKKMNFKFPVDENYRLKSIDLFLYSKKGLEKKYSMDISTFKNINPKPEKKKNIDQISPESKIINKSQNLPVSLSPFPIDPSTHKNISNLGEDKIFENKDVATKNTIINPENTLQPN